MRLTTPLANRPLPLRGASTESVESDGSAFGALLTGNPLFRNHTTAYRESADGLASAGASAGAGSGARRGHDLHSPESEQLARHHLAHRTMTTAEITHVLAYETPTPSVYRSRRTWTDSTRACPDRRRRRCCRDG